MVYGNRGIKLGGSKKKKEKSRSASPARGKSKSQSKSKPRERERERTRSPSVRKKSLTRSRSPSRGRSPTLKPRSRSASVQPRRVRQPSLSIDRMAASGRKSTKTRADVKRAYYAEDGSYIPIADRRKGSKGLPPKAPPRHKPSSAWKRAEDVHDRFYQRRAQERSKSQPHGNLRDDTHTPKHTEAYKKYRRATSKSPHRVHSRVTRPTCGASKRGGSGANRP